MNPELRITAVVERQLKERAAPRTPGRDDDLREAGLTSMDMLHLVLSIEAEFNLTIPEESISPANFRSIGAISRLIETLLPPA